MAKTVIVNKEKAKELNIQQIGNKGNSFVLLDLSKMPAHITSIDKYWKYLCEKNIIKNDIENGKI
jgi:hypothetical protein